MKSLLIGRGKGCDVVINEPSVGREHAELISDSETRFMLVDHDSKNGTYLWRNGTWVRVKSTNVGLKDQVRLGHYETSIEKLVAAVTGRRRLVERNPKTGEIIERRKS